MQHELVRLDQNDANGYEYSCVFVSNGDEPDDSFQDANCDGIDGIAANAVFVAPHLLVMTLMREQ